MATDVRRIYLWSSVLSLLSGVLSACAVSASNAVVVAHDPTPERPVLHEWHGIYGPQAHSVQEVLRETGADVSPASVLERLRDVGDPADSPPAARAWADGLEDIGGWLDPRDARWLGAEAQRWWVVFRDSGALETVMSICEPALRANSQLSRRLVQRCRDAYSLRAAVVAAAWALERASHDPAPLRALLDAARPRLEAPRGDCLTPEDDAVIMAYLEHGGRERRRGKIPR